MGGQRGEHGGHKEERGAGRPHSSARREPVVRLGWAQRARPPHALPPHSRAPQRPVADTSRPHTPRPQPPAAVCQPPHNRGNRGGGGWPSVPPPPPPARLAPGQTGILPGRPLPCQVVASAL
ncbi:bifunctional epoxide hydrolase 2 [Platysternon megacephalum]|uniref:Bifunctional epoxide hydrolase 2 n=1 Tax=Platysternon megacephalum TaxID=55544 RepID=A0A4D9E7D4_9SAUR|nr:bifunctional epoxide hydrolase 2 [Platysternon megacephalum]